MLLGFFKQLGPSRIVVVVDFLEIDKVKVLCGFADKLAPLVLVVVIVGVDEGRTQEGIIGQEFECF